MHAPVTVTDLPAPVCAGCGAEALIRVVTPDGGAGRCALCVIALVGSVPGSRITVLLDVTEATA